MTEPSPPPVDTYQPLTFRERGLAVTFTTPLLSGARIRPAHKPSSLEVIVPNPSGGRGVYILAWENVREICVPTLHDTRLGTALETHHGLDRPLNPAEIRRITRNVLNEGFAGRSAALAASTATTASEKLGANAHRELLTQLAGAAAGVDTPALQAMARDVMAPIALEIGCNVDEVVSGLERMAHAVAELGLGQSTSSGFVSRNLADLAELISLVGHVEAVSAVAAGDARFVVTNAELTLSLARRAVGIAMAGLADVKRALVDWAMRPALILEAAARPEWLLDGWPRICMLSRTMSGHGDLSATLAEMAILVPPIPPQADDWLSLPSGTSTRANPQHQGSRGAMPSGALMPGIVARNEQFLAMVA